MPNPFLRTQHNTSKTPTERPHPTLPVMESYAGHNNPWRGTETHGVDPNDDPADPITPTVNIDGRNTLVEYVEPDKIPDPIPVKIVQDSAREYREFWTDRVTLTDGRSSILGRDDHRVTSRIINTDAAKTVYVASSAADLLIRGYPLGPGKELVIASEMPIYAVASDGSAVVIGLYVETSIPERVR